MIWKYKSGAERTGFLPTPTIPSAEQNVLLPPPPALPFHMSSLTLPALRKALGADPRKATLISINDMELVDIDALSLLPKSDCVTLNVERNRIRDLKGVTGVKRTLRHLFLAHNDLRSLGDDVAALEALQSLNSSHNSLTQCPVGRLLNLTRLDLSHNALTAAALVSGGLGKLVSLVSLDLSHNPVNSWPAALSAFPKLQSLTLDHCGLSSLPALGAMTSLRTFRLCDNNLQSLAFLKGLQRLQKLWLSNNTELSDFSAVTGVPSLSWIECRGCAGAIEAKKNLSIAGRVIVCQDDESSAPQDPQQDQDAVSEKKKKKTGKQKKKKPKKAKGDQVDGQGQVIAVGLRISRVFFCFLRMQLGCCASGEGRKACEEVKKETKDGRGIDFGN